MRVLVGGIGYRNLSDHSIGVMAVDVLMQREWPSHVSVEDVSYGPVAVAQRLDDEHVDERFDRIIAVSAVARGDRPAGTITAYRWDQVLPPAEDVQRAVTEAITGVIAMDNTLIVCRQFGALPDDAIVVEVEPLLEEAGETFSAALAGVMDELCATVTRLATDATAAAALPTAPLGGPVAAGDRRR